MSHNPVEHAVNQIRHSMGNNYVNFKLEYGEYLTETRLLELLQIARMGGIIRAAGLSVVPKSSTGHVLPLEESRALEKNDDGQTDGTNPNSNQTQVPTSQQGASLPPQIGPPIPNYVTQLPVSTAAHVNGNTDPSMEVQIQNADTNVVYGGYSSYFGIYPQKARSGPTGNQHTSKGFEYINYADSSNSAPVTSGTTSQTDGQTNMNSAGQPGNNNNIPCSGLLHNLTSELFMELDPPGVATSMNQSAVTGHYPIMPSNGDPEVQAQQGQQVQWDQQNGQVATSVGQTEVPCTGGNSVITSQPLGATLMPKESMRMEENPQQTADDTAVSDLLAIGQVQMEDSTLQKEANSLEEKRDKPLVDQDVSSSLCVGCGRSRSGSRDRADIAHPIHVPCSECGHHDSDSSEGSLSKVRRNKKTKKRAKPTEGVAPVVVAPLAHPVANGAHQRRRVSWADENGAALTREKTISPRREVVEANLRRRNVLRRMLAREPQSIGSAMRQMAADGHMGRYVERLRDEDEQEQEEESPRYPRPITAKSIPLSARRRMEETGRMIDKELEDEPPLNEVDRISSVNQRPFGHDSTACDCVVCQGLRKHTKRGRGEKRATHTNQPSSSSNGNNGSANRWDRHTSASDSDIEIIKVIPHARPSTSSSLTSAGSGFVCLVEKRRASPHDQSPVKKRKRTLLSQPAVEKDLAEQPGSSGSNSMNRNEVQSERGCILLRPFMMVAEQVRNTPYTRVEVFNRPRLDEEFEKLVANQHVPLSDDETGDWEPIGAVRIGTNGTGPIGNDTKGVAPVGGDVAPDASGTAPEAEDGGAAPAFRGTTTRRAALKDGDEAMIKDPVAGASRVVGSTPRMDFGDLASSSGSQPSRVGSQPKDVPATLSGTSSAASDPKLSGPLKLELRPDMNAPHLMNDVHIHFAMENLAILGPDPIATYYLDVTDEGAIVSKREMRKRRR